MTSWLTDLDVDLWPPQAIPRWDTFGQGRLQRPVLGGDEQRVGPVKELAEQLSPGLPAAGCATLQPVRLPRGVVSERDAQLVAGPGGGPLERSDSDAHTGVGDPLLTVGSRQQQVVAVRSSNAMARSRSLVSWSGRWMSSSRYPVFGCCSYSVSGPFQAASTTTKKSSGLELFP